MELIGTAGISSDEEIPRVNGEMRRYGVFLKPWRADALLHLYRHLDLIHAATRNPNGNPIRTRVQLMRTRGSGKVPKKLPLDCYNPLFLREATILEREFLEPRADYGVENLLSAVRRLQ